MSMARVVEMDDTGTFFSLPQGGMEALNKVAHVAAYLPRVCLAHVDLVKAFKTTGPPGKCMMPPCTYWKLAHCAVWNNDQVILFLLQASRRRVQCHFWSNSRRTRHHSTQGCSRQMPVKIWRALLLLWVGAVARQSQIYRDFHTCNHVCLMMIVSLSASLSLVSLVFSLCLCLFLSVCLSVSLSACLSVCLCLSLSLSL